MEDSESEPDAHFTVAVEDFGGAWANVAQALQERLPLNNITFTNKFGNSVHVNNLHIRFVQTGDVRYAKLRPFLESAVTWFRKPFALLFVVGGEDADEYKRSVRVRLRELVDRAGEAQPGAAPDWLVVYACPLVAGPASKAAGKVFAALRGDFSERKRERCVRLDALPGGRLGGAEEWARLLGAALRETFEARARAYDAEVRRLMAARQQAGWRFEELFLAKDSLARMLEAAGMAEDALRELSELEACFLEAQAPGGALAGLPFGGGGAGDDAAALLAASWRAARRAVLERGGLQQFHFRQFLFACQARLLLQLQRPGEVAERGRDFVAAFGGQLRRRHLPPLFCEAWTFSACLALAAACARALPPAQRALSREGFPGAVHVQAAAGGSPRQGHVGSDAAAGTTEATRASAFAGPRAPTAAASGKPVAASPLGPRDRQPAGPGPGSGSGSGSPPRRLQTDRAENGTMGTGSPTQSIPVKRASAAEAAPVDWGLDFVPRQPAGQDAALRDAALSGAADALPMEAPAPQGFWAAEAALLCMARTELTRLGLRLGLAAALPASALHACELPRRAPQERGSPKRASHPRALFAPDAPRGEPSQQRPVSQPGTPRRGTAPAAEAPSVEAPRVARHVRSRSDAGAFPADLPPAASVAARAEVAAERPDAGEVEEVAAPVPASASAEEGHILSMADSAASLSWLYGSTWGMAQLTAVETGSGASSPRTPRPCVPPLPDGAALPAWLTDWRLCTALASQERFEELWVELSTAAAACAAAAGRRRSAALLGYEVAGVLAARGRAAAGAAGAGANLALCLREGWARLAAAALPDALALCRAACPAELPQLCLRMLALPLAAAPQLPRAELQAHLLAAALEQAAPTGQQAAGGASLLGPPPGDGCLDAGQALWAEPVRFSQFYGQTDAAGAPVLAPGRSWDSETGNPQRGGRTCATACVGDVVTVEVDVMSRLPDALPLAGACLRLALLQELSVALTPRESGELGGTAAAGEGARFGTRWTETEEVACLLVKCAGERTLLRPGRTRLTFHATLLKRGLYVAQRLRADLGALSLALSACAPGTGGPPAASPSMVALGEVDADGRLRGELAVLEDGAALRTLACGGRDGDAVLQARGNQWVAVTGEGGGAELPAWAAREPSLLWLHVHAGSAPAAPQAVRIEPAGARPAGSVELDVGVDYEDGCQRSHVSRLAVPVLLPVRVSVAARELPGGRIALQAMLTSNLPWPAELLSARLALQPGFVERPSALLLDDQLPMQVAARGTAALLLFAEADGRGRGVAHPVREPERGAEEVLCCEFVLEAGGEGDAPRNTVFVRLLGPFAARAGEPLTLCWRLERGGAPLSAGGADEAAPAAVPYEVAADDDAWAPAGTRSGVVALAPAAGAVGTVEAAWQPLSAGTLPVPRLRLRGVAQRDLFDVGAGHDFVQVAAAALFAGVPL
ncbi:hypothetical protein WJX81_004662 [Elliptochloris bilobata]|uniref:TRAPPC10/Trs130 N-terminal domain-containing protein n=1 Tax=Elliptochloris bilobata TaxID=381761 RepID=A0AAW1QKG7_9CHLO